VVEACNQAVNHRIFDRPCMASRRARRKGAKAMARYGSRYPPIRDGTSFYQSDPVVAVVETPFTTG
jgi:hypothetical protein